MRQERKELLKKSEKFEEGVLRVDACAERYCLPREEQFRTPEEDLPGSSFGRSAVWEERRLMCQVYQLISRGIRPQGDCPLEEFVEKHRDLLGEEVI